MNQLILYITLDVVIILVGMIVKYEIYTYGKTYKLRHLVSSVMAVAAVMWCFVNILYDIDKWAAASSRPLGRG